MGDSEVVEESPEKSCSSEEGEYNLSVSACSASSEADEAGFRIDFSSWTRDTPSGLNYLSVVPFDYFGAGHEFAPGHEQYTSKIKTSRRSRLVCRRGAVVLHTNPLGKEWQAGKKLHSAVTAGDYNMVSKLLEDGVNPSSADDKHRTALHIASAKGVEDIVRLLLSHGADPNLKDVIGNTALHLAVCSNHIGVVTQLLKGGANAHALDRNGRTPLHLAHSRLTRDAECTCYTSQQLRREVTEIIGMLKMYMSCMGRSGEVHQLEKLCVKLQETSTKAEVDEIQEMLVGFTNMSLQKHNDGI
ncbi:ankyrin repeat domain-containing protein 54-like [Glandiceps talaboti]